MDTLLNKISNFTKTIRFRMTLAYSTILFLLSGLLILSLNIYLDSYLQTDPILNAPRRQMMNYLPKEFNDLEREERMRIREIRLEDLERIQELSIISLIPMAVISFVMGYALAGYFLKPLHNLELEIENMESKDLGKTLDIEVDDEVGALVRSYNKMSVRLKQSFDAQEKFVQDASHEIKTPLTIIQTNLDTILEDKTASKDELRESITNSLAGVKKMRNLTDYLMQLTVPGNVDKENLNINEIINEIRVDLKDYAKSNNVNISYNLPEKGANVKGDKVGLKRAFTNIIENAIKYSSESKDPTVHVKVAKEKKNVIVTVEDNGIGIPKEHINKIFERFYRVDKSRSRKTGGFGLGLAITKKIIEENNADISVVSENGHTVFKVEFYQ